MWFSLIALKLIFMRNVLVWSHFNKDNLNWLNLIKFKILYSNILNFEFNLCEFYFFINSI